MTKETNVGLEIANELLVICKQMFRQYTGQEISTAKQLIAIEERLSNIKRSEVLPPDTETTKPICKQEIDYIQKVGRTERTKTPLTDTEKKELDKGKLPLNKDFDSQPPEVIPEKPKVEIPKPF